MHNNSWTTWMRLWAEIKLILGKATYSQLSAVTLKNSTHKKTQSRTDMWTIKCTCDYTYRNTPKRKNIRLWYTNECRIECRSDFGKNVNNIHQSNRSSDEEQLIANSNTYVEYQLIHMRKQNLIINMSRPPDSPKEKFTNPFTELKIKLVEIGSPMINIILTGDLNFPIRKWQMET